MCIEKRELNWDWDAIGSNKEVEGVGNFYFHAGRCEPFRMSRTG